MNKFIKRLGCTSFILTAACFCGGLVAAATTKAGRGVKGGSKHQQPTGAKIPVERGWHHRFGQPPPPPPPPSSPRFSGGGLHRGHQRHQPEPGFRAGHGRPAGIPGVWHEHRPLQPMKKCVGPQCPRQGGGQPWQWIHHGKLTPPPPPPGFFGEGPSGRGVVGAYGYRGVPGAR